MSAHTRTGCQEAPAPAMREHDTSPSPEKGTRGTAVLPTSDIRTPSRGGSGGSSNSDSDTGRQRRQHEGQRPHAHTRRETRQGIGPQWQRTRERPDIGGTHSSRGRDTPLPTNCTAWGVRWNHPSGKPEHEEGPTANASVPPTTGPFSARDRDRSCSAGRARVLPSHSCINDPSTGSPTETLLRLLLPLDSQVRPSSQHSARAVGRPRRGRSEGLTKPSNR